MSNSLLFKQEPESEQEIEFPAVPVQVVEALEQMFPDKLPDLNVSDRYLGQLIGQVNVVKFLREMSGRRT